LQDRGATFAYDPFGSVSVQGVAILVLVIGADPSDSGLLSLYYLECVVGTSLIDFALSEARSRAERDRGARRRADQVVARVFYVATAST
jgi:hypothetical protein